MNITPGLYVIDVAAAVLRKNNLIIGNNDSKEVDEWGDKIGYHFPAEIIEKFKEASHTLKQAGEMAQRADRLVSGDDGEESYAKSFNKAYPGRKQAFLLDKPAHTS
jgi:hypothetical protein